MGLAKAAANLRARRELRRGGDRPGGRLALTRDDPAAIEEARFVTLGLSSEANLLVVVYAYREPDVIRLISAWKANKRQRHL